MVSSPVEVATRMETLLRAAATLHCTMNTLGFLPPLLIAPKGRINGEVRDSFQCNTAPRNLCPAQKWDVVGECVLQLSQLTRGSRTRCNIWHRFTRVDFFAGIIFPVAAEQ
jgi:hypothetical protein